MTFGRIRLLPLGVPLLGGSKGDQPTQKDATCPATSPGKAKAAGVAASRPKRRRKETVPIPKAAAEVTVAQPVEKPTAIPERRRKGPIPPAGPPPDNPAVLADRKS